MDASTPPDGTWTPVGQWTLDVVASVADVRRRVAAVAAEHDIDRQDPGSPLLTATPERLAMVCAELATNGVRHGGLPVTVVLARGDGFWLIVVSDRCAAGTPDPTGPAPVLATGGDVGGTGLALVVAASERVGWYVTGVAKHVWAELADRPPERWAAALRGVPRYASPTPLRASPRTAWEG
jgi:anti-sigma regulatory factor (Ser/Thr protein kinase)